MRKFLTIMLIALFLSSMLFIGCGGGEEEAQTEETTMEEAQETVEEAADETMEEVDDAMEEMKDTMESHMEEGH